MKVKNEGLSLQLLRHDFWRERCVESLDVAFEARLRETRH